MKKLKMVEVVPTQDQIQWAKARAKELGHIPNSITRGEGNVYGFLGEKIVADILRALMIENCKDYDLVLNKYTIDVKTSHCNTTPMPHYNCHVATTSKHQKCDYYIFVRVMKDLSMAWILGKKKQSEFFDEATEAVKDSPDTEAAKPWNFPADCYNLTIEQLDGIKYEIEK